MLLTLDFSRSEVLLIQWESLEAFGFHKWNSNLTCKNTATTTVTAVMPARVRVSEKSRHSSSIFGVLPVFVISVRFAMLILFMCAVLKWCVHSVENYERSAVLQLTDINPLDCLESVPLHKHAVFRKMLPKYFMKYGTFSVRNKQ